MQIPIYFIIIFLLFGNQDRATMCFELLKMSY